MGNSVARGSWTCHTRSRKAHSALPETRGDVTCRSLSSACPRPSPSHLWSTNTDVFRHSPGRTSRPDAVRVADPLAGIDPTFVFDFRSYDDLDDGQRWSTWPSVEPLCRGPEPRPDWVVTSQGAIDTELGILKTGKEADVFLLERADPLRPRPAAW